MIVLAKDLFLAEFAEFLLLWVFGVGMGYSLRMASAGEMRVTK